MNNIIDKFLFARDNLIPEMHLGQPGFTFSASELFTKNKTRIQKFNRSNRRLQVYLQEQSRSVLNKIWHMKISKIYQKRSDKVLRDKAFEIASNPKYDGYQRGLGSIVYKTFV